MDFPIGSPAFGFHTPLSQGETNAYGWVLVIFALAVVVVALVGLSREVSSARRRFWCASAAREVEVSFLEEGFRRPVVVLGCSMFTPPTAMTCQRGCLDQESRVKVPRKSLFEWKRS